MTKGQKVTAVEKVWLSNGEAQAYLGVGSDFMEGLRAKLMVAYYKVGHTIFYKKADLDRLLERNRIG